MSTSKKTTIPQKVMIQTMAMSMQPVISSSVINLIIKEANKMSIIVEWISSQL